MSLLLLFRGGTIVGGSAPSGSVADQGRTSLNKPETGKAVTSKPEKGRAR